jgi:hypothetical protein
LLEANVRVHRAEDALFKATPGEGEVEHWVVSFAAQDCPADESLAAKCRGMLARLIGSGDSLELAEQVVEADHTQESSLAGKEALQREAVDVEVFFEFTQTQFDLCAAIVFLPELSRTFAAVGVQYSVGITRLP